MRAALLLALTALAPAAAAPRTQVAPYVELDQVVEADLGRDDTVTWTELAAGVDASIATARAQGQVSYRYERRFAESGRVRDADFHTGLARASYRVARPVTIEAGAIATRARSDIRGAAPSITDGAFQDNITQIYALYIGPTLTTQAGPVGIGASYRFGYTKVEAPGVVTLPPEAARRDYFDSSRGHQVAVSASVPPNRFAPIGATVSAGYDLELASQLDQRFEDRFARLDVLAPLTRTVAITAGVGYEKIEVAQRDPVTDASGAAVPGRDGRFVTDPASPRRVAYNTDGLIYDAGVVWRPSPRTSLTATVAHEYDSTAYTGAFNWRVDRDVAFSAAAYDTVETFGRQLRVGLQGLPTSFVTERDSFGQQFNGCVFNAQPGVAGQGAGGCLSDVFQSINTAAYRARGVDAVLSAVRGRDRFGLGAGYATRHLFHPRAAPNATVQGLSDNSLYLQGFYARSLDEGSAVDANVFANWYDSASPGGGGIFGAGATGAYTRSFGRLGTVAQLGVYTVNRPSYEDQWTAQALLGARYQF